jgi:hypothetical protein
MNQNPLQRADPGSLSTTDPSSLNLLELSGSSSTWQILVFPSGATRTMAGWWHVFVSLPIFQFLMVRWLWRYLIWCRLLWRISRLDLQLIPTHPDQLK